MVTCVDKANVFRSFALFRQVFFDVAASYPDIEANAVYVDAMSLYLVQNPGDFDVLVMENQFGDILSDLGAGIVGGLGLGPSGEIGHSCWSRGSSVPCSSLRRRLRVWHWSGCLPLAPHSSTSAGLCSV